VEVCMCCNISQKLKQKQGKAEYIHLNIKYKLSNELKLSAATTHNANTRSELRKSTTSVVYFG
jgi:hypothetical protein